MAHIFWARPNTVVLHQTFAIFLSSTYSWTIFASWRCHNAGRKRNGPLPHTSSREVVFRSFSNLCTQKSFSFTSPFVCKPFNIFLTQTPLWHLGFFSLQAACVATQTLSISITSFFSNLRTSSHRLHLIIFIFPFSKKKKKTSFMALPVLRV